MPEPEQCLAFRIQLSDVEGSSITVQVIGKSAEDFIGMAACDIKKSTIEEESQVDRFSRVMRALEQHVGNSADFYVLAEPVSSNGKRLYRLFGTRFNYTL